MDKMTMMSNDRHIAIQTDLTSGLTELDQQCNRNKSGTTDFTGKREGSCLAFLKISASAHLAHLQSRTGRPSTQLCKRAKFCQLTKTIKNENTK